MLPTVTVPQILVLKILTHCLAVLTILFVLNLTEYFHIQQTAASSMSAKILTQICKFQFALSQFIFLLFIYLFFPVSNAALIKFGLAEEWYAKIKPALRTVVPLIAIILLTQSKRIQLTKPTMQNVEKLLTVNRQSLYTSVIIPISISMTTTARFSAMILNFMQIVVIQVGTLNVLKMATNCLIYRNTVLLTKICRGVLCRGLIFSP